jgi:hypothetical protein
MSLSFPLHAARRFVASRPEARGFAARAWLAAPVVRASLAVLGFESTLRWVEAVSERPPTGGRTAHAGHAGGSAPRPPVSVTEGSALVRGAFRVHAALGLGLGRDRGDCLPQSVVQYLLHRRDGVPARLVVGVKRLDRGAAIAAHAWVEAGPKGTGDAEFEPLFTTETVGGAV